MSYDRPSGDCPGRIKINISVVVKICGAYRVPVAIDFVHIISKKKKKKEHRKSGEKIFFFPVNFFMTKSPKNVLDIFLFCSQVCRWSSLFLFVFSDRRRIFFRFLIVIIVVRVSTRFFFFCVDNASRILINSVRNVTFGPCFEIPVP